MIYFGADNHGYYDLEKLLKFNADNQQLTKADKLILLGDTGLFFDTQKRPLTEAAIRGVLENCNFTILFIDGNHEDHDALATLPTVFKYGADVGKVSESIYHLRRGRVYIIDGLKFFTMGGAKSVDKHEREADFLKTGVKSIWTKETPSAEEIDFAFENLAKHKFKVDFVLTHTAPSTRKDQIATIRNLIKQFDHTESILEDIRRSTKFKYWLMGHYHCDLRLDEKFICLFRDIISFSDLDKYNP